MAISPAEIRNWTIYKITSPTGRLYIGVTSNYKNRIRTYHGGWKQSQPLIMRSLSKYGATNHSFEIVDTFMSDLAYALGKEMFFIRSYMSNRHKWPEQNGMNLTDGGQGTLGWKMSEKQKKQNSDRVKGFKHTEEAKKKISEASKGNKHGIGHKWTEEKRVSMIGLMKGNKYGKGPNENNKIALRESAKKRRKPVNQYDLYGNLVAKYNSVQDAAIGSKVSISAIKAILCGQYNKMKGFTFKYK